MNRDELARAAREAWLLTSKRRDATGPSDQWLNVVDALEPLIRANIADRIAARWSDANNLPHDEQSAYTEGIMDAYDIAEQIARGELNA
jgi:hypothetical protein